MECFGSCRQVYITSMRINTLYGMWRKRNDMRSNVTTDDMQVTSDGKYEYKLELVNLFQKNAYARLYIKNVDSRTERRIRVPMDISQIHGINISANSPNYWTIVELTAVPGIYSLQTTKDFPLKKEFIIDMDNGVIERIESFNQPFNQQASSDSLRSYRIPELDHL